MRGCLCVADYAWGLLGARGKKKLKKNNFFLIFSKKNFFQKKNELRIHLSADSYLWSIHLVSNIVKAMF